VRHECGIRQVRHNCLTDCDSTSSNKIKTTLTIDFPPIAIDSVLRTWVKNNDNTQAGNNVIRFIIIVRFEVFDGGDYEEWSLLRY
jgi:hypothetical protein